ncbi:MAG: hypothetical protein U0231_10390 [Nitrospiraceae bacterium]
MNPSDLEMPGATWWLLLTPVWYQWRRPASILGRRVGGDMGGVLVRPVILTVIVYLFLKFVVPNLLHSAPLPSSLILYNFHAYAYFMAW